MAKIRISSSWLEQFIRFGFLSKGIIYLITGLIAIRASISTYQVTGTSEALDQVAINLVGKLLLAILAIGLSGYVLWRLIQAVTDPEYDGELTAKRVLQRIGYATSGLSYAGVSYTIMSLTVGFAEQDDAVEDLASELTKHWWGLWVLLLSGMTVIIIGGSFVYGAYTGAYIGAFKSSTDRTIRRWTTWIGQVGYMARGISFITIGFFIALAAILADAASAGGLSSSLQYLQQWPFGAFGLGGIGFGFVAYSVYMFLAAWYRRF